MEAKTGLHIGVWVYPGVWIPIWGYTQVFENARAFGSPTGAMYRRLVPQPRLHTDVWIPNRGYIQVLNCLDLDPQLGLHTGIWIPK